MSGSSSVEMWRRGREGGAGVVAVVWNCGGERGGEGSTRCHVHSVTAAGAGWLTRLCCCCFIGCSGAALAVTLVSGATGLVGVSDVHGTVLQRPCCTLD